MSTDNFVFVYHKDYAETVTRNFKSFLDDNLYIDLIFVCRNNKKVGAHQVVLGCLSKFFYSIFEENVNTAKEKVLHIYVPDIRAKIMKYILQFIYSGKTMLNKDELAEFNEDIKLLGMPLDHFSSPNENTENGEPLSADVPITTAQNTAPCARVSPVIKDTVDLTESNSNEKVPLVSSAIPVSDTDFNSINREIAALPPIAPASINNDSTEDKLSRVSCESNSESASVLENSKIGDCSNNKNSSTACTEGDVDTKVFMDKKRKKSVDHSIRKRKLSRKLTACINLESDNDEDDVITIG